MRDFRKLQVWQKAHALTLEVYRTTMKFPKDEVYGLTSQMRRSSASVPTNLAEGCGRDSDAELARFVVIAAGSASELEYQLLLARDLQYIDGPTFERLASAANEVKRMLAGFIQTLKPGSVRLKVDG